MLFVVYNVILMMHGHTNIKLWKVISLKIEDISPSQKCWKKAAPQKSVSCNICMEIRGGHYEHFTYKSAKPKSEMTFPNTCLCSGNIFLLLWRIFYFCTFGHEHLFHSIYFKSVVTKLRIDTFADPHFIQGCWQVLSSIRLKKTI